MTYLVNPPARRGKRRVWRSELVDDSHLRVYRLDGTEESTYLIDPDMAERVVEFSWFVGQQGYARTRALGNHTVCLQHVVLDRLPTPHLVGVIDHINSDVRDNRRENLAYVTQRLNSRKKVTGTGDMHCITKVYHRYRVRVRPRSNGCPIAENYEMALELRDRFDYLIECGLDSKLQRSLATSLVREGYPS